jgi:hypothetical protein
MEVHFTPDVQTKLSWVASQDNGSAEDYVQQLVERYLDHDLWFREKSGRGRTNRTEANA